MDAPPRHKAYSRCKGSEFYELRKWNGEGNEKDGRKAVCFLWGRMLQERRGCDDQGSGALSNHSQVVLLVWSR